MKNDNDQRRRAPRTHMVLKVEYEEPFDLLADYLTDLGQGGLFICTTAPFEVGQKINFTVSFPGLLDPIPVTGVVRWRRDQSAKRDGRLPGIGVEFDVSDAQHREEIARLLERCQIATRASPVTDSRPFRVLLVEDNPFTHDLYKHAVKRFYGQLERSGALEITSAKNGQEGLVELKKHSFDLAIVDYFLPVASGAEVIREMRKDPELQKTPVMVISVGGDGVREDALAAGADLYVDKPVMLKQLLNTLHLLVSSRATVVR
jgi:uncharacterized protein (TIGR02266 family)